MKAAAAVPHRALVTIWAAMALSVVMYFAVLFLIGDVPDQPNPALATSFMVLAMVLVAASFPVRRALAARSAATGVSSPAGMILALAMCEAAALFGLVLRLVTGFPQYYILLLLGLIGILLHYPRQES